MLHILLADDSRFFRTIERQFLQKTPASVDEVEGSDELFAKLQVELPQLLFLSCALRPLDGIECCRLIKADPGLRSLPVIMICEQGASQQLDDARKAGSDATLTKPLDRQTFLAAGRQFLSEIREHRKPCFMVVHFSWEGEARRGKCLDISSGGLFLESQLEIPVGTSMKLEFVLPDNGTPVSCLGEVAWHNRRPKLLKPHYPVGFGLRFLNLPESLGRIMGQVALNRT